MNDTIFILDPASFGIIITSRMHPAFRLLAKAKFPPRMSRVARIHLNNNISPAGHARLPFPSLMLDIILHDHVPKKTKTKLCSIIKSILPANDIIASRGSCMSCDECGS
jgi:hypothetical protein